MKIHDRATCPGEEAAASVVADAVFSALVTLGCSDDSVRELLARLLAANDATERG